MSAAELNNLSSGLIGAVIGSVLGFLGSVIVDQRKERERRKAAGRAVLAEMIINAGRVLSAEATTLQYELVDHVWRQQLPLVATLFDWDKLRKLVVAYDSGSSIAIQSRLYDPFKMDQFHQTEAKDLLLRHAEEWLLGIDILAQTVLDSRETSALSSEVKKLRERLAISRKILRP